MKSTTTLWLAAVLTILILPCKAQYASSQTATRSETVRDSNGGEEPGALACRVVHGVVQGQQGALPGATVALEGSRTIAVTNSEGEFELRVPATATRITLVCGYGGLQEETVSLAPVRAMGSLYLLRAKTPAAAN